MDLGSLQDGLEEVHVVIGKDLLVEPHELKKFVHLYVTSEDDWHGTSTDLALLRCQDLGLDCLHDGHREFEEEDVPLLQERLEQEGEEPKEEQEEQ